MAFQPELTKVLSESGHVFDARTVAVRIVDASAAKQFNISVGLDGWLLAHSQPGLSPVNTAGDVVSSVLFPGLCRLISVFYLVYFDIVVKQYWNKEKANGPNSTPAGGEGVQSSLAPGEKDASVGVDDSRAKNSTENSTFVADSPPAAGNTPKLRLKSNSK